MQQPGNKSQDNEGESNVVDEPMSELPIDGMTPDEIVAAVRKLMAMVYNNEGQSGDNG